MPEVRSETIQTLEEFVRFVEDLSRASPDPHWYRGCGNACHELLPTLYRHPQKTEISDILQLEANLLKWFKQRSVLYQTCQLTSDWDCLFFMQQYRVPTRLLDWTESPLVALYFALTNAHLERTNAGLEYQTDAAIWVLTPGVWNQTALSEMTYGRDMPFPGGDDGALNAHAPGTSADKMKPKPVALHGVHNSARIAAQRGTFVIFGHDTRSMERIHSAYGFPAEALVKLVIPAERIADLLDSSLRVGITDSVVFPDLEGLGMEARRHFGFEV